MTEELIAELPDDLRVPLHELQADLDWLFGCVATGASTATMMADSVRSRLTRIETACYALQSELAAMRLQRDDARELAMRLNSGGKKLEARIAELEAVLKPGASK